MKSKIIIFISIIALILTGCSMTDKQEINYDYVVYGVVENINNDALKLIRVERYNIRSYDSYYNHIYDGQEGFILNEYEEPVTVNIGASKTDNISEGDLIEIHYHNSEITEIIKSDEVLVQKPEGDINIITEIYKMPSIEPDYEEEYDVIYYTDLNYTMCVYAYKAENYLILDETECSFDMDKYYAYIIGMDGEDYYTEILITDGEYDNYILYYSDDILYIVKAYGTLTADGSGIVDFVRESDDTDFDITVDGECVYEETVLEDGLYEFEGGTGFFQIMEVE